MSDKFCSSVLFDGSWGTATKEHLIQKLNNKEKIEWNDLPATTQWLFLGVAREWWPDVDIRRGAPIPFANVFNVRAMPSHFKTMAQVLAHLKIFDSVGKAMKAGWNKPISLGEFWLSQKTIRVHIVWIEEDGEELFDLSFKDGFLENRKNNPFVTPNDIKKLRENTGSLLSGNDFRRPRKNGTFKIEARPQSFFDNHKVWNGLDQP